MEENKSIVDQDMASGYGTEEGVANVYESTAAYGTDLTQTPEPAYEKHVPQQSAGNLLIITGSFKSRENAVNQVDDLNSQGYNAEIIVAQNGYFRVSAMRYRLGNGRELNYFVVKISGTSILKINYLISFPLPLRFRNHHYKLCRFCPQP